MPDLAADEECRCDVGVQRCPAHPNHLKTPIERIAFEKAWDLRVQKGKS